MIDATGYVDLPQINNITTKQRPKIIKIRKKALQNFNFYNPRNALTGTMRRNKSIGAEKTQIKLQINSEKTSLVQTKLHETPGNSAKTSILVSPCRTEEKHYAITRKGHIPIKIEKPNQDSYFILERKTCEEAGKFLIVYAVFDGHGLYGHIVSQFVSEFIKNYITSCVNEELKEDESKRILLGGNSINKFINKLFKECSTSLENKFKEENKSTEELTGKLSKSGTTACIVFIYDGKVTCANLGDSKAVLYMHKAYTNLSYIYELSKDHNLKNPLERERIVANDGKIERYQNRKGIFVGPERVWLKSGGAPGLAMTRSFGDLIAHTVGVSDVPEIKEFNLTQNNLYTLVLGSDGLWEHLSASSILKIAKSFKGNPEECSKALMEASTEEWRSKDKMIDDITIIVSNLDYQ